MAVGWMGRGVVRLELTRAVQGMAACCATSRVVAADCGPAGAVLVAWGWEGTGVGSLGAGGAAQGPAAWVRLVMG